MPPRDAARSATDWVRRLVGKDPLGVTAVAPVDNGWLVEVEVLEERRIPSSADVLALYAVELDLDGTLLAYRRSKRYSRGQSLRA